MPGEVFTVNETLVEVSDGEQVPLITTLQFEEASDTLTGLIVSEAEVAPVMFPVFVKFTLPFLHWYVKPVPIAVTENPAELPAHAA